MKKQNSEERLEPHFKMTGYGFEWGAATVERMCSDEKKGWVYIGVKTPRGEIRVYVTKTGKIRVWNCKTGEELK